MEYFLLIMFFMGFMMSGWYVGQMKDAKIRNPEMPITYFEGVIGMVVFGVGVFVCLTII